MNLAEKNGDWLSQVERQAARIRSQIASMTAYAQQSGGSVKDIEGICAPFYNTLAKLYREDYPLAHAIETSDLLLRLEGQYLHGRTPKVSLISSVFTMVRRKVGGVAYALSGLVEAAQKSKEVDLELSAYSTGSLYLGFNLSNTDEDGDGAGTKGMLGENEPLYKATREAIRTIGIVSQRVSSGMDEIESVKDIPDPLVRDTTLAAVQGFSPSTRSHIDSIMIIGREMENKSFVTLTPTVRKNVREWLHKPIQSDESAEFGGVVREIDLDLHRITIRRIEGGKINEIRCIYTEDKVKSPRDFVDKSVIISGKVQRDNFGNPRLLQIENINLKDGGNKPPEPQLF